MDPDKASLDDIYFAALEKADGEERSAYLDDVCGVNAPLRARVERLLSAQPKVASFLESPAPGIGALPTIDQRITETPGATIDCYKLLEQIGEGGFGVVFMAEQQEPVRRKVALKIIKPGMDTKEVIARFEAERQALAIMDHPNIAKMLDGGVTESGRPYFVMGLVRGVPITDFCDQNNLAARERLELFEKVCRAVQHAHQKGIIHRDIKPSNVLVTMHDDKPVPKVIDFGVAKATHGRLTERTLLTRFAQMIGTPLYMSPEQAQMSGLDVDTRADIYSLGVLLYELLTGTTPFDQNRIREAAHDELLRIIREEEPPRPSTRVSTLGDAATTSSAHRQTDPKRLSQFLRGELDWIVMNALEKDRTRRYETADAFAGDIERYLNDEPVTACPPSAAYRFKKFVVRNKGPLFAVAVVAAALLLGVVISTWQAIRATKAERLAEERLAAEGVAHEGTRQAERESLERLLDSYLAQAKASRRSGQPGQRLGSLKAIREAATLIPRLGLGDEERLELRNEAIAAMGLIDLEQESHVVLPRRDWWVTFDPQMKHYACMDASNELAIWRLADGQRISRLPMSVPPTQEAPRRFTPDGRYLVGIGPWPDGWVWDVQRSELVLRFKTSVSAYASKNKLFSSRRGVLAVVVADESVQLFELGNGTQVHSLATQAKSVALSVDGAKLAVSSAQNTGIEIWDCQTGLPVRVLNTPFVTAMAWHPNGKYLACTNEDGFEIHVWDIETGSRRAELAGHRNEGLDFCFSHDGALLASAGWDGLGRLWDPLGDRELLRTAGKRCEFAGQGDALMLTNAVEASIWRVCRSRECLTLRPADTLRKTIFEDVDFWWDGPMLAGARGDGIRIWNLQSNRELAYAPIGYTDSVLFHQATCSLISSGSSGVYQWPIAISDDSASWRIGPPRKLSERKDLSLTSETNLALSRDGSHIVATIGYDVAVVLDLAGETEPVALPGHADVSCLAVSPNGQWVATGDLKGARIWNSQTGEMVTEIRTDGERQSMSFGPNGKWLAAAGISHIRLFEVGCWELVHEFAVHQVGRGVSWSSDGRLLVVTSGNVATLLNPATGVQVARITSPNEEENIQSLRLNSDGRLAIVHRTAIEVWDLRLVRRHLAEMGLDWDLPPLPPPAHETAPRRVEFDLGTLAPQPRRENYIEQARLHAMREDWQAAAEDYAKAFDSGTTNLEYLFEIAAGLLVGGKPEKYQQVCRSMFQEHGQTDDDRTAYLLARPATFGHDEYGNPDTRRLATLAVEATPHCAWYLHTLGMAYYREGQYREAVKYFERSAEQHWEAHIANWITLAMAYHQLGEEDKSRQRWLQARNWLKKPQALHPHDRVAVKVLHDEAKQMLSPTETKKPIGEEAERSPNRPK